MKRLLTVTAAIESGGAALICFPRMAVWLLLGAPLDGPAGLTAARVCGVALLTLGIACWFAHRDGVSRASKGLVDAMTFYNVAVVAVLTYAGIGLGLSGMLLWPAVVLHIAMATWSRFSSWSTQ